MFSDPPVGCVAGQHYVSTHCEISLLCSNVVSDLGGRYLITAGRTYDTPVLLLSVYTLKWDNPDFFKHPFSNFPDISMHFQTTVFGSSQTESVFFYKDSGCRRRKTAILVAVRL